MWQNGRSRIIIIVMSNHVLAEAERCFLCKKPMCSMGCPIHTPIPQMIKLLRDGKIRDAGDLLFNNNPLSVVCSIVCDHDKQCEGHCIQGRKGQPVHCSTIENYISNTCLEQVNVPIPPCNGIMVGIIGAGPAGITVAIEMAKRGYRVTLFDSKPKIGGVMQYGIPEYRLPKSILERYRKKLVSFGILIRPNTTIGGALEIKDMFRDGYKAIFIGTGVWRPKKLGIKGETYGNVHFAIDYLVSPDSYSLGDNVAIIGMGNTAIDVARTLLRQGTRNVTLYARSGNATASKEEVEYAKLDGANFAFGYSPVEITHEGPVFDQTILDENGKVTGYKNEPKLYPASSTVIAVSQGPKSKLVDTTEGLKASSKGLLLTDEGGMTTYPGIFAAGDVVLGARTVVEATAYAKTAAAKMDEYIRALPECQDVFASENKEEAAE